MTLRALSPTLVLHYCPCGHSTAYTLDRCGRNMRTMCPACLAVTDWRRPPRTDLDRDGAIRAAVPTTPPAAQRHDEAA